MHQPSHKGQCHHIADSWSVGGMSAQSNGQRHDTDGEAHSYARPVRLVQDLVLPVNEQGIKTCTCVEWSYFQIISEYLINLYINVLEIIINVLKLKDTKEISAWGKQRFYCHIYPLTYLNLLKPSGFFPYQQV